MSFHICFAIFSLCGSTHDYVDCWSAHRYSAARDSFIVIFNSYTKYNRTYQIQKCNIIEHNIKEMTEYNEYK